MTEARNSKRIKLSTPELEERNKILQRLQENGQMDRCVFLRRLIVCRSQGFCSVDILTYCESLQTKELFSCQADTSRSMAGGNEARDEFGSQTKWRDL